METSNKLRVVDYSTRVIMALVAVSILVMLLTSLVSGIIAMVLLALAVLLIFFSITGFKKLKNIF